MIARLRSPWAPVALWLLGMAICAAIVARAVFTADMSAFLPKAPTAEQQLLVDQLSEGVVSRLMLVAIEGADAPARAAVSRRMAAQLRGDARFIAASNGESGSLAADQAFLFDHRYQLSPAMNPERFTVTGLRTAVQETLDLLASPAGLLVKQVLQRDPTGETAMLLEQLAFESAGAKNRPNAVEGVWASRDGGRALLLLQTRATGGDIDGQQQAVAAATAAFAHARAAAASTAAANPPRLLLAGPGVFGVNVRELIQNEVTRLSIAGATVIVMVLLALYRSVPALLLGLLPVASGVLVAVAAVSLGFGTVHGLTLGFGTTLIGEAVDYSIYFLVQSGQGAGSRQEWVRGFWPTVRLGVLTSIFGFSALLFSGFPGLAQLGLYSIAGLATAALVTRFVLPRLLPAKFAVREMPRLGDWLLVCLRRSASLRLPVGILIALSVVVLVLNRDRLWNHELAALSPVSAQDQALDQTLRADLGAPDVRSLVLISGATQEEVLVAAERAAAALKPLVERNAIGAVDSPTHLLPSVATQRLRLAAIPPGDELARRLQDALAPLPLKADKLGPFLADAQQARESAPLRRADLDGTTLAVAVDGMLVRRPGAGGAPEHWSAFLPLHAPRPPTVVAAAPAIDAASVKAALTLLGPSQTGTRTVFVDLKNEADALYSGYLRQATLLSLAGVAAIAVLMAVSLRSLRRMAGVMVPLAGTVVAVMGLLSLTGQRLTILHLVGLLLVVAVGSNYALFFSRAQAGAGPDAQAISASTLTSLLFASLTTVAGFGILAFSSVPVLKAIGMTVGPGAILALLFAAAFNAGRPRGAAL